MQNAVKSSYNALVSKYDEISTQSSYTEQLEITDDVRKTSYDFTNSLFRYDYYSIKENSDSIYYDV